MNMKNSKIWKTLRNCILELLLRQSLWKRYLQNGLPIHKCVHVTGNSKRIYLEPLIDIHINIPKLLKVSYFMGFSYLFYVAFWRYHRKVVETVGIKGLQAIYVRGVMHDNIRVENTVYGIQKSIDRQHWIYFCVKVQRIAMTHVVCI
jgi:hypothetical protein